MDKDTKQRLLELERKVMQLEAEQAYLRFEATARWDQQRRDREFDQIMIKAMA